MWLWVTALILGSVVVGGVALIPIEDIQAEELGFFDSLTTNEQEQVIQLLLSQNTSPVYLESRSNLYTDMWMIDEDSFNMVVGADVINYLENGSLKDINLSILESDDPVFFWEANKSVYKALFKNNANSGQTVKIEIKGHELFIQPHSIDYTNSIGQLQFISNVEDSVPIVIDNKINYSNAFGEGIDLVYQFQNSQLKQFVVIANKSNVAEAEQYMFPNMCQVFCNSHEITFNVNFVFSFDSNIEVLIDGIIWQPENQINTASSIILRDKSTKETIYIFQEPVTIGNGTAIFGEYNLKQQGNSLFITQKTDYGFIGVDDNYPIEIDPTTALNFSQILFYQEINSCQDTGNCCNPGFGGTCVESITSNCGQVGSGLGLTEFASSCSSCTEGFGCCNANGTFGRYQFHVFNLSQGINNSFPAITIDEARLNISVTSGDRFTTLNVTHADSNDSIDLGGECKLLVAHTFDTAPNNARLNMSDFLSFNVTPHVQGNVNVNQDLIYFLITSRDNFDSGNNIMNRTILNVTFSVNSCEFFPSSNTEIKCSDNCSFTYFHGEAITKNLSITGDGNLTFNNFNVSMGFLNLSGDSTACNIWFMNETQWNWSTELV